MRKACLRPLLLGEATAGMASSKCARPPCRLRDQAPWLGHDTGLLQSAQQQAGMAAYVVACCEFCWGSHRTAASASRNAPLHCPAVRKCIGFNLLGLS